MPDDNKIAPIDATFDDVVSSIAPEIEKREMITENSEQNDFLFYSYGDNLDRIRAVSYTHLTLPTIYSV